MSASRTSPKGRGGAARGTTVTQGKGRQRPGTQAKGRQAAPAKGNQASPQAKGKQANTQAKGKQTIPQGRRLILHLPGGGGNGRASERTKDEVKRDVSLGYLSLEQAAHDYRHVFEDN